jgi:BirA family biotin operon repressor/biotin-[acetyl-CoA-carboxylase] ligase
MVEREVLDSTSDLAAELLRGSGVALPLGVRALRQTRGRGRGSHEWWSDEGSLTFTLAIDPAAHGLERGLEPRVGLAMAVAVIDALRELGFSELDFGIKWPNDLECAGKKLGGILTEPLERKDGRCLLIGVGLNVQTNLDEAPAPVRAMATSLAVLSAKPLETDMPERLMAAIYSHFESILRRLVSGDRDLPERWNTLDVLRDLPVRVDVGTHVVIGQGQGIDEEGALCLQVGNGVTRLFGGSVLR